MTDAPLSEIVLESLEKYYWPSLRNTAVALDGRKKRDQRTDGQGVSRSRIDGFITLKKKNVYLSTAGVNRTKQI